jgi:hypothetical protein
LFDRMTDDVSKVANELFICDLAGLDGWRYDCNITLIELSGLPAPVAIENFD